MQILVVDDDPVILDLLTGCLTDIEDYTVTCCDSAEAALRMIDGQIQPFDCVLLDIMLPGIDGIEMCRNLRRREAYHSTPILMITASRAVDLMGRAFDAGATDFIGKPLNGVEIGARIATASLLNASIAREKQAQHTLAELTALTRIGFDEPIKLRSPAVCEMLSLENHLLRLQMGCFAMNLFSIHIQEARGIYRTVDARAFRRSLEAVAEVAGRVLDARKTKLAYVGSGRFAGIVRGRARLDTADLAATMNTSLAKSWNSGATCLPVAPKLEVGTISAQRIWSGLSASEKLREHVEQTSSRTQVSVDHEQDLFARLDSVMSRK